MLSLALLACCIIVYLLQMDNGSAREQRANARGAAAVAAATATPQEGTIATTIVGQNDTFMPLEIPAITGVLEDPASGNFNLIY